MGKTSKLSEPETSATGVSLHTIPESVATPPRLYYEVGYTKGLIELVALQQGDVASPERFVCHSSGGTLFQTGYRVDSLRIPTESGTTPLT